MDRVAYIGGQMRGVEEFNFPAFYAMEEFLWSTKKFCRVYNPARMDDEENDIALDERGQVTMDTLRRCLRRDLIAIIDECTTLVLLNGWHGSKGANVEYRLADALNLELLYEDDIRQNGIPGSLQDDGAAVVPGTTYPSTHGFGAYARTPEDS